MPLIKNLEAMTKAVIDEPMAFVTTFIAQILVLIGLVIGSFVVLSLSFLLIGSENAFSLSLESFLSNLSVLIENHLALLVVVLILILILSLLFFSLSESLGFNAVFYYYKKGQFSIKNAFDSLMIKKLIGGLILLVLSYLVLCILSAVNIVIFTLIFYLLFPGAYILNFVSSLCFVIIYFLLLIIAMLPLQTFLYRVYANKNINVLSVFTEHLGLYKNKEHWIFLIKFFILSIIIAIILYVINLILSYIPIPYLGTLIYWILNPLIGIIFGATIFKELDDLGLLYIKEERKEKAEKR
jgi:hypothetical protein